MIKLHTIGGYSEVGKNMTAVEIGDDAFIFDCGLFLPPVVEIEDHKPGGYDEKQLRGIDAIPNDLVIKGIRNKVRAMLISHAHLDHIGAVPYMAHNYKAPVIATPFTTEVLHSLIKDNVNIKFNNQIKPIAPNSSFIIKGKKKEYKAELINITHSTLQTALIALHTDKGVILYANDFKFDNSPILGKRPNYKRLKELAKQGVLALVVDSLYSDLERKTPSEKIARGLLEDVLLTTTNENACIGVTTFSSHIARLKSIVDCGKQLNRKILFLGRSLHRYVSAASRVKLVPFIKDIQLLTYRTQLERALKKVSRERAKYMLVCTGHQGEPGSILDRLARGVLPFRFQSRDHIIFSSSIIPSPINMAHRKQLEKKFKEIGMRIFTDVHVSVLPNTQVVINQKNGMEIKEIQNVNQKIKTPAFDKDLKIKWFDAELVKHNYKGKIFKVETKSGRKVDITSGHSLFILENGQVKEIKGDNLKEGDYVAIPKQFSWYKELKEINLREFIDFNKSKFARYRENKKWICYANKKICKKKIKLSKSFARLLGYYLAEGSAPRHISLVFNINEKDLIDEVKKAIKKISPCSVNISKAIDKSSAELTFGARILGRMFKKWFGKNAKTKRIPSFVFSASKDFKLNFLGAYINGDGSIDRKYKRIRIKTVSEKLASDLLYLFAQVGICAKFDHKEKIPQRLIGNNKKLSKESFSYVVRIQSRDSLTKIYRYLSTKFKLELFDFLFGARRKPYITMPPESLPISKLALSEIKTKKHTSFEWMIKRKKHVNPRIILRDSVKIGPATKKIINGDLLFDPIVKIKVKNYKGDVYDFKVPGAENFIGGFGGIMLHNSGHCGREDLRDMIEMLNPQHIIPAHGDMSKLTPLIELATELGYKLGKDAHLMQDGQHLDLK